VRATHRKMRSLALILTTLATLAGAGCGPTNHGTWTADGFEQRAYHWRAAYAQPAKHRLLPDDWQLDNWRVGDDGTPDEPKQGNDYVAVRDIDKNRDGTPDKQRDEFIYDLRFVNARDNGVIWVQTYGLHPDDARRELDVILTNYADSLAGTGLYAQATVWGTRTDRARTYTTLVSPPQRLTLGDHHGLVTTIDLAEVERWRVDPSYRSGKLRIALLKFHYPVEVSNVSALNARPVPPPTMRRNGRLYELKTAVLLAGYANDAARFDDHTADFEHFLTQLTLPDAPPVTDDSVPPEASPSVPPAAPPLLVPVLEAPAESAAPATLQ